MLVLCVRCTNAPRTEYEGLTGNPIPYDHGEQVVWLADRQPARVALLAVAKPALEVAEDVRRLVETQWSVSDDKPLLAQEPGVVSLRSKAYHATADTSSALIVDIHVFPDATAWSLVVLSRSDRWRSRGREFHTGCPSPFKGWSTTSVVTDAELNLIRDHYNNTGVNTALGYPANWFDPLGDPAALARLRTGLASGTSAK